MRIRRLTLAATEVVSIDNAPRSASSGLLLTVASEDAIPGLVADSIFYLSELLAVGVTFHRLQRVIRAATFLHIAGQLSAMSPLLRHALQAYSAWNSLHFPATDSHLSSVAETSTFVSSGRMRCHECFSILQ